MGRRRPEGGPRPGVGNPPGGPAVLADGHTGPLGGPDSGTATQRAAQVTLIFDSIRTRPS